MTSPRRVPPARMPLLLAIVGGLAATVADAADDPRTWLDRMGYALEYLNYEGTLIQLHGSEASVMHVVHRVEGGVPTERIKALDDVGREIIRRGGDVTCILPDQQSVLVEKGGAGAPGTSPLREQFTRDVRFDDRLYKLAIAGGGRLVGRDTRVVTVQPTDNYRYGYRLWLDHATAMPLKVQVSGEDGEVVEQLLFTNIELPGAIPESAVQPSVMVDKFARQAWPGAAPAATAGSVPSGWEVGFLPPPVHIRDNLELKPGGYRILLRGVPVAEGELQPGHFLAINPGRAAGALAGTPTRDPAFGLPATWIDPAGRDGAQMQGYTVVDSASVAATHFSHVLQTHAARLLGRQETQGLLDHLARSSPRLVEDLVPKLLPLAAVQRVLQNLLEESIPVRDLRGILETLAECAPRTQDPGELTAAVRVALGPAIVQHVFGPAPELGVIVLEPDLERLLLQSAPGADGALEPGLAEAIARQAADATSRRESLGESAALVVPDRLRPALARLLRRAAPQLKVLGHAEIPDSKTLRVHAVIGARP